jgi:hypothetical protein
MRPGLMMLMILWGGLALAMRLMSQPVTAESQANYELLLGARYPPPQPGQFYWQLPLVEAMLLQNRPDITVLPSEIGQLGNLQWLNLEGNPLTALPPEIGLLTNLIVLDLRNTLITELPPGLEDNPNLTIFLD